MAEISLVGVPAITLLNPWAWAITQYGKDVENRSWMPPEHVYRLMIHAGKRWDVWPDEVPRADLPLVHTSAIVAVADLLHACNASRWTEQLVCQCGPWARPGQCHWRLHNVRVLARPVPCGGSQRLWYPGAALVEQVLANVNGVPTEAEIAAGYDEFFPGSS